MVDTHLHPFSLTGFSRSENKIAAVFALKGDCGTWLHTDVQNLGATRAGTGAELSPGHRASGEMESAVLAGC